MWLWSFHFFFLFQGGPLWNVLRFLILASLSFFHYIPFLLSILLNRCSIYQNFCCQNKFYWALKLNYVIFFSCNNKGEKSLDLNKNWCVLSWDVYCQQICHELPALQIKVGQWSITANLWPLTSLIHHVMIIVTSGISKKSFFIIFRSSHALMFFKTGVIRNFAIFIGKHQCWSLFLIKLQAFWVFISTLSKKRLQHKQFFLYNTSGGCFCQFEKVTVQWWASANLLLLIKAKIWRMVSTKKVFRSGQIMLFTHY